MAEQADARLMARVDALVAHVNTELGSQLPSPGIAGSVDGAAEVVRQIARDALTRLESMADDDERIEPSTELVLRATQLERELRGRGLALRERRREGVEQALSRLRHLRSSAELLDGVCHEIVDGCGFKRAMLSRVRANSWNPWMVHFEGEDRSKAFATWIEEREVTLDQLPLERSVVAEREPKIVRDAVADPRTYKPFVEAGRLRSYVVAPIIPAGRVVGFLHADHGTSVVVDDSDRDVLSAFAEAFGRLYERMVVLERMRAQRSYVRETFEVAESMMLSLATSDIELEGRREDDSRAIQRFIQEPTPVSAAIDELLTAREKDVIAMLVHGHSNAEIAERLVIKVGTVKSHVKRILRKIGAVNRAEAISRYMDGRPD